MLRGNKEQEKSNFNISLIIREIMAIMTINKVVKAGSASWTGNYSLIWSGLKGKIFVVRASNKNFAPWPWLLL